MARVDHSRDGGERLRPADRWPNQVNVELSPRLAEPVRMVDMRIPRRVINVDQHEAERRPVDHGGPSVLGPATGYV